MSVERRYPRVGIIALVNGWGFLSMKKTSNISMYVSARILIFLCHEFSHAFSASTRLLRALSISISCWSDSRVIVDVFIL